MTCTRNAHLSDLAAEVARIAQSSEMQNRRELWVRHFDCERQGKIPVNCAMFIAQDDVVWSRLIPEEQRVYHHSLEAKLELAMRQRIYKFKHIPDDDVINPTLWLRALCSAGQPHAWGVPVEVEHSTEHWGSYKPQPAIKSPADLEHLRYPVFTIEKDKSAQLVERATELLNGHLTVKLHTDLLHFGPWEWAVRLRGIENLLYDVIDQPEFVHRLMEHVTTGLVNYHQQREASGAYDAESSLGLHQPYDNILPGLEHRLGGGWVYCHAQSSASLSPSMYAEFVHPYNVRIASLFRRVYYHGCENLSKKAAIVRELPGLRHFHVSPWTNPEEVIPKLRGQSVVLEVHSHPTNVLFLFNAEQIRQELRERIAQSQGMVFDLKLCDIQTIEGADGKLQMWTQIAQEESVI